MSVARRVGPRVGLVLGGGGSVGAAYHAGALAALEHDLGWDPRGADVIVGTSAGAVVGALLRRGVASTDLAATTVGARWLDSDPTMMHALEDRPSFPPIGIRTLLRLPRPPTPGTVFGLVRLAAQQRAIPVAALSALMPEGREVLTQHLAFLDGGGGEGAWPDERLLVCAVRRKDLQRTTFGATPPCPALSLAVAASCAVPGYFTGVDIDGDRYVDGGVASATNADVLASYDLDLAIVISPMTGIGHPSMSQVVRAFCRRTLRRELRALNEAGIPTVVVEPGPQVLRYMTLNFMSEARSTEIVRGALLDTGSQITQNALLRELSVRRPERARRVTEFHSAAAGS